MQAISRWALAPVGCATAREPDGCFFANRTTEGPPSGPVPVGPRLGATTSFPTRQTVALATVALDLPFRG
jgi:hypothetical protein